MAAYCNGGDGHVRQRFNYRGIQESFVGGIHMTVEQLKNKDLHDSFYIAKPVATLHDEPDANSIPHYPQPLEFRVSKVGHVTTKEGLDGILSSGGFKGGINNLLWWGLVVRPWEIAKTQHRYLNTVYPNIPNYVKKNQVHFLRKFTKSPAFRYASRYGNFQFALPLKEILLAYCFQFCGGAMPILRLWETIVYKQEIMYSVLVHSPDVPDYDQYPELGDNEEGVCAYRNGKIIWRAQAISKTHRYRLIENRHVGEGLISAQPVVNEAFYVWDHVTLAFHIPEGELLSFPPDRLYDCLTACSNGDIALNKLIGRHRANIIVQGRKRKNGFNGWLN